MLRITAPAALAALLSALILLMTRRNVLCRVSVQPREASLLNSLFRRRVIITALCAAFLIVAAKAEDRAACIPATLGTFETAGVLDARTFKLRDGREVLLAGIEVPSGRASAKASLERLLAAGTVVLKQAESADDRYGRLIVQAYVPRDGVERWIQADLLAAGDAQVGTRPGDAACAKALRAAEARPDAAGSGYGPIRLTAQRLPTISPGCCNAAANSPWRRGKFCLCGKAVAQYT